MNMVGEMISKLIELGKEKNKTRLSIFSNQLPADKGLEGTRPVAEVRLLLLFELFRLLPRELPLLDDLEELEELLLLLLLDELEDRDRDLGMSTDPSAAIACSADGALMSASVKSLGIEKPMVGASILADASPLILNPGRSTSREGPLKSTSPPTPAAPDRSQLGALMSTSA